MLEMSNDSYNQFISFKEFKYLNMHTRDEQFDTLKIHLLSYFKRQMRRLCYYNICQLVELSSTDISVFALVKQICGELYGCKRTDFMNFVQSRATFSSPSLSAEITSSCVQLHGPSFPCKKKIPFGQCYLFTMFDLLISLSCRNQVLNIALLLKISVLQQ